MAITLHSLQNEKGAKRRSSRVGRGRGSGSGKTSGKGHKGQSSRSGYKRKAGFEGGQMPLFRRLPKRGFHNRSSVTYIPVNVSALDVFDAGAEVTPEKIRSAGLAKGPGSGIKILGNGELKKKLSVKAQAFSAAARAKIEAAGGSCEIVK